MARRGHSGASENAIGLLQFYEDLKLLSLNSQQQGKAAVQKVATASIARQDERKYVTLMKHVTSSRKAESYSSQDGFLNYNVIDKEIKS